MSRRQSLVRFLVVIAPILLFSVKATPSRAQSAGDSATATAPLYKTISIKPSKSGIDAGGFVKLGPDELSTTNASPQVIIEHAYEVQDDQIVGAPSWLNSKRYDIEAKADNPAAGEDGGRLLESGLLSQYFKLAAHRETRLIPVYELVIAGDGPKLRESDSHHDDSALRVIQVESGRITGREVPMATLAKILSDQLGRPVVDSTKLSAHYDVALQWQTAPESSEPRIMTAIQEQLGLKLVLDRESQPIPVYELVVAADGPKLQKSACADADCAVIQVESGRIMGREVPIATLARILSQQLGRPVLDETQLPYHYDVSLQWPAPQSSDSAILAAIQDQLGLKLVPQLMPKEFLVIDHVEKPSAE
jgi:uncharacterized protein (TIGR03435 family)